MQIINVGRDSSVGTATRCGLDGAGIEILSQWTSGLRRGSAADRLLGLRVRIRLKAWMFVCCKYKQKAKCRTIKIQTQVGMKYRVRENKKKVSVGKRLSDKAA